MKSFFRVVGLVLLLGGIVVAGFYFLYFSSVATPGVEHPGAHSNNSIDLSGERFNGMTFGLGAAIVGGMLIYLGGSSAIGVTASKRKCPYCAESIKIEANICRYCGKDVSISASHAQSPEDIGDASRSPYRSTKSLSLILIAALLITSALYYFFGFRGYNSALIIESKNGIEKYLVDPGTVQYRNISNAKSLDGLRFEVDRARVSELVRDMTANLENFPGVPYSVIQAELEGVKLKSMSAAQKEADKRNAEILNGSLKGVTGVCLEFNAKNKSGGYTGYETALCLHRKGINEAECLNISLKATGDMLSANFSAVCK